MQAFNRDAIYQDLKPDDNGTWQSLVDLGYDEWQKQDWSFEDMIQYCKLKYGEIVELAILTGKYHQQVLNGGHFQYFDNGYSGTHDERYREYDHGVPLTQRMRALLEKYELVNTDYGKKVHSIIVDFINRTTHWADSQDRDLLHESMETGEEDDFPSYDDLDDSYYAVQEWWEHEIKRYFNLWLEFNTDPIKADKF